MTRLWTLAAAALVAATCLTPLTADDETDSDGTPAGHSAHGDAFNEGPRQRAYLMPATGKVSFPVTSKHPEVRKFVEQGVGQIHGFWWFEAERTFRHVASLDPDCALAYWGMAMANLKYKPARARAFIDKGMARIANASPREQMYLRSVKAYLDAPASDPAGRIKAYSEALAAIHAKFPDDLEAVALRAVVMWENSRHLKAKAEEIDALIVKILEAEPLHPAHHYKIHLWDGRDAKRALASAARCGQSAPSVAHMWHMPGHIYTRLNRFADAAWQQEASARTDHAYLMRDHVLPDQIFNYAHNNEWLVRNLMILGRVRDAMDLAKNMIELPRHPKYNTFKRSYGSASYGRRRLFGVLEYFEMWKETIEMTDGTYLEPTDDLAEQARRLRARALAFIMQRKFTSGRKALRALHAKRPSVEQALAEAGKEAEEKARKEGLSSKDRKRRIADAQRQPKKLLETIDSSVIEMNCYLLLAARRAPDAIRQIEKAKTMPEERRSRFYLAAGDTAKAEKLIRKAVKSRPKRVQPLANMVDILWRCGKKADAAKAFVELRKVSHSIDDLKWPVFKRLAPYARALRLPSDWRVKRETPDDVGVRPDLDKLGPFRWTSYEAAPWKLPDHEEKTMSLSGFAGRKPVVVIFYLGYGCAHCVEQLAAFKPAAAKFKKLGVKIVAISTDTVAELKKSLGKGGFPFPLVSNAAMDVFKQYRCFDDFEDKPLHGTFLIDSRGVVRWQDISYEPFTDTAFLLKETPRLLGQKLTRR